MVTRDIKIMDPIIIKEIQDLKAEVTVIGEKFVNYTDESVVNNIKMIIKRSIFFKYLLQVTKENYNINSILSDYIFLLKSIENQELRYFHLNMRSLIEHYLRLFNGLNPKSEVYNFNLIEETKIKLQNLSIDNVDISIIISNYKNACNFVHGNINAEMPILEFYYETVESESSSKAMKKYINQFCKLNNELFNLFLYTNRDLIDAAFHRKKTVLKYIVNEKYVNKLRELEG